MAAETGIEFNFKDNVQVTLRDQEQKASIIVDSNRNGYQDKGDLFVDVAGGNISVETNGQKFAMNNPELAAKVMEAVRGTGFSSATTSQQAAADASKLGDLATQVASAVIKSASEGHAH